MEPEKHVLISAVTGISIAELRKAAGSGHNGRDDVLTVKGNHEVLPIYRAMPNTAIAIRESMTCIASKGSKRGEPEVDFEIKILFAYSRMLGLGDV